jgi:hypothetical protein
VICDTGLLAKANHSVIKVKVDEVLSEVLFKVHEHHDAVQEGLHVLYTCRVWDLVWVSTLGFS